MAFKKCFVKSSAAGIILALSTLAGAQTTGKAALRSGSVVLSSLKMYQEICGTDDAMALLHRSAGAIEILRRIVPSLSNDWNVAAVDMHVHGRTRDIHRPFCYELVAGQVANLINYLSRVV
jgi:hypothetical protein